MTILNTKYCVFDAYGTLFDVHSAVGRHQVELGEKAGAVSQTWRTKQLEYTWLRSLMQRYVNFWQVTQDGLDYALDAHGVENPELREKLLQAYHELACYPEVPDTLKQLRQRGHGTAILSNGTAEMLASGVRNSQLEGLLDAVLSVEEIGVFKPDPRVYQFALERLGVSAPEVLFFSSNAWDVAGAASFGFQAVRVNRFGQPPERLPGSPVLEIPTLDAVLNHLAQ
jgi:2-haloacid dehalogenase